MNNDIRECIKGWGDGIVPLEAAHLEGAKQITIEGESIELEVVEYGMEHVC